MMIQERIVGLRKYMAQYGLEQVLMGNPINITTSPRWAPGGATGPPSSM